MLGSHLPQQGRQCLSRTNSARCKPAAFPGAPPPPAPSCHAPAVRTGPPPPPAGRSRGRNGTGRDGGGVRQARPQARPHHGVPAAPQPPTCSSVASHSSHWLVRSVGSCPPARNKYLQEGVRRAGAALRLRPRSPVPSRCPAAPPVLTGRWRWGRRGRRRCPAAGRAPTASTAATGAALRGGRAGREAWGGHGGGLPVPRVPPSRCCRFPPQPSQQRPDLPGGSNTTAPGRRRTRRPPPPSAPRGRPPPPAAASPLMQPGREGDGFRDRASG